MFIATATSGGMTYYAYFTTLRVPSYNLLAVASSFVATGLLLQLVKRNNAARNAPAMAIAYGAALGICALAKPTTMVAVALCHAAYFVLLSHKREPRDRVLVAGFAATGLVLVLGLLELADPGWWSAVAVGVRATRLLDGRDVFSALNAMRWDLQSTSGMSVAYAIPAMALVMAAIRWRRDEGACTAITGIAVVAIALVLAWGQHAPWWLSVTFVAVASLWCIPILLRDRIEVHREDLHSGASLLLLFIMPLCVSFGTNASVADHSRSAAAFVAVAALMQLVRMLRAHALSRESVAALMVVLCVPAIVTQVRTIIDPRYAYRLPTELARQTIPVPIGRAGSVVLVDEATEGSIRALVQTATSAGFMKDAPVVDLTGEGPGLVYAMGGRPVGATWLLGGYPGSRVVAADTLNRVAPALVHGAWVLASTGGSRAITGWMELVVEPSSAAHRTLAGTLQFPRSYRWSPRDGPILAVQLWTPATGAR
jgi:hypothetical protein